MIIEKRIAALAALGKLMQQDESFIVAIKSAHYKNNWFTESFVQFAVDAIINQFLQPNSLQQFADKYSMLPAFHSNKKLGIIMAGNIPLVGFHDFLCAYLCGIHTAIKLSSKDDELMQFVLQLLATIDPESTQQIQIVEKLENIDLVIATGSNNTNRYFEQYFKNIPRLLRQSRYSVAVLDGNETNENLQQLADDIFLYFGLGCRNVSHIFVPTGYDITRLFSFFAKYEWLHHHTKYMNNYDYLRAIYLLNKQLHFANEFLMLLEDEPFKPAIAKLTYSYYDNLFSLTNFLNENSSKLQVIASNCDFSSENLAAISAKFGNCQLPTISDFADGEDTMDFILKNG